MKEGEFIETYLRLDKEGDYVAQISALPFLRRRQSLRHL